MTSIARTTPQQTTTHPAWCDPRQCHYAPDGGVHWGTPHSIALHTDEGPDDATREGRFSHATCEISLSLSDDDAEPLVWLDVTACEVVTLADLERFALWLAERAAELRAAIEAEAGR
jgi:hypothetical protein